MGTAKQDFERFVRWLHEPARRASEPSRRFANIVLANFDSVARTARQHNNRSQRLAQLARPHLAGTSADLPGLQAGAPAAGWPWTRLQNLTLGPFRGFRESVSFDLRKRILLCFGPNGSGKTSLCEGLEYSLRGTVEEAGAKRIAEAEYLKNIHAGRFDPPVLMALDGNGRSVRVQANEETFRFFFVEKNRIDDFSRMAAAPPGRRGDLIAALFGMDQFNDFASHFNESMDAALTLGTTAQTQLASRRHALANDEALVARETEKLAESDRLAEEYANTFTAGFTYADLKTHIGSVAAPGRLQQLAERLRTLPPAVTNLSRESLRQQYADAEQRHEEVAAIANTLQERQTQLSFRDLYVAVQSLGVADASQCPACETLIANTATNPFERAARGLDQLRDLAELEERHDAAVRALDQAGRDLREELRNIFSFLERAGARDSIVYRHLAALPRTPEGPAWWLPVLHPERDGSGNTPSLEVILAVADDAAAQDAQTIEAIAARNADIAEQARLNDANLWIAGHDAQRAAIVDSAAQARTRIAQWEQVNAAAIQAAAREREANARDLPISEAYNEFVESLGEFRQQLPGMLVADLNTTAMEIYNEFNHQDRDEDKLAELLLPMTGDQVIRVAFRGAPARRVNALQTLSEGHIRCLGLAILLAKASAVGAPLIIFDDAINAIDHDHRSGIRAAIFESDRFTQTQIIVTCHSPEFIKDIENHLPQPMRADCQQYVLQHHTGDHQPRVNPNVGTANYLIRARQEMARFDPRGALSFARKALEMLMNKAWKWLESHRVGNISVLIEGPGKEPQLRNLCEALRSRLQGNQTFAHPSKQPLVEGLQLILGIPEQNLVWLLLNKGTHEEANRDDFDLPSVEIVLSVLERIDRLEMRPGR